MNNQYTLLYANINDLESWMELVTLVRHEFLPLEQDEALEDYKQTLIKNIKRQSAICAKHNNAIVGILIFSPNQNCLGCMAVHPGHRSEGIATAMIKEMLAKLPQEENVWVTTYREDDSKGNAPRALYKKLGFVEDELTMDFDYPHQKFVLIRKELP